MSSKPSNQKTILSEAFISFSGMTLGSVFRYIFSIVMARFLGAQMLGIYSLGNAVTRIAEIFALMGLDNGVLRFVSRDTENSENVNNSIYSSLKAGLLSSIIISIILFLSADFIVNNLLNEDKFLITVIKVFAISLPFSVLTLISSFATQAFKILKYKGEATASSTSYNSPPPRQGGSMSRPGGSMSGRPPPRGGMKNVILWKDLK